MTGLHQSGPNQSDIALDHAVNYTGIPHMHNGTGIPHIHNGTAIPHIHDGRGISHTHNGTGIPREMQFTEDSLVSVLAYSVMFIIASVGNLTVFITLFRR